MKVQNVLVYTGYVEDSSTGCLAMQHRVGFDSVEEMLRHLGECFLTSLRMEKENHYWMKCCRKAREDGNKHCKDCGNLVDDKKIDHEALSQYITEMQRSTADSSGGEFWEIMNSNNWVLWGGHWSKGNDFTNVTILGENGDVTLADLALGAKIGKTDKYELKCPKGSRLREKK